MQESINCLHAHSFFQHIIFIYQRQTTTVFLSISSLTFYHHITVSTLKSLLTVCITVCMYICSLNKVSLSTTNYSILLYLISHLRLIHLLTLIPYRKLLTYFSSSRPPNLSIPKPPQASRHPDPPPPPTRPQPH